MNSYIRVFADTSFYYAVLDPRDSNHPKAKETAEEIARQNTSIISTWEVIVETVTLLRMRHSFLGAVSFIKKVLPTIEIFYLTDAIRARSLDLFLKFASDKKLSLCDVVSFVVIKEYLDQIPCLAFDEDFRKLGLKVV